MCITCRALTRHLTDARACTCTCASRNPFHVVSPPLPAAHLSAALRVPLSPPPPPLTLLLPPPPPPPLLPDVMPSSSSSLVPVPTTPGVHTLLPSTYTCHPEPSPTISFNFNFPSTFQLRHHLTLPLTLLTEDSQYFKFRGDDVHPARIATEPALGLTPNSV